MRKALRAGVRRHAAPAVGWAAARAVPPLTIVGLVALAAGQLDAGRAWSGATAVALAALLALALLSRAQPVSWRARSRREAALAGLASWALVLGAIALAWLEPAGDDLARSRRRAVHALIRAAARLIVHSAERLHEGAGLRVAVELPAFAAAALCALTARWLLRPASGGHGHDAEQDQAARAIIERYGEDTLIPFMLRPDKALYFAAEGVISYQVIGETAIVSGDPVAPPGRACELLGSFLKAAHERGWRVVVWGASSQQLDCCRRLGLRSLCAGEEAFVEPARFTLEGRPVRKLRQSVARARRRGFEIFALEGRELDAKLEAELHELERQWRAEHPKLIGFAMSLGEFSPEIRPDDLFVLARSPTGRLGAAMRFAACRGRLSLDTMRRVGETPNGLNEALVCRALELARERGVSEVSLNYAGLAHLLRRDGRGGGKLRARVLMALLGGRFQMQRLVRFDEKFSPYWRPRYLVYETPAALPRAVLRVLQAEGYLPSRAAPRRRRQPLPSMRPARRPA
jgi:lysyl-tRNA synthetase class 2